MLTDGGFWGGELQKGHEIHGFFVAVSSFLLCWVMSQDFFLLFYQNAVCL